MQENRSFLVYLLRVTTRMTPILAANSDKIVISNVIPARQKEIQHYNKNSHENTQIRAY